MGKFICVICGKSFVNKKTVGITCSMECRKKRQELLSKKIIRKCSYCGKVIKVNPSELRKDNFCNWDCFIKFLKQKAIDYKNITKGKSVSYDGYYWYSNKKIHRVIMEHKLGRKLLPTEIVHHINFDKLDNRIENLQLVSRSEHNKIHKFLKKEAHYEQEKE